MLSGGTCEVCTTLAFLLFPHLKKKTIATHFFLVPPFSSPNQTCECVFFFGVLVFFFFPHIVAL